MIQTTLNFRTLNYITDDEIRDVCILSGAVESATDKMLMRLPVVIDWVNYKGEDVVIQWNYEATEKAQKPMVDVSYCMTKALNQVILKTVNGIKVNLSRAVWELRNGSGILFNVKAMGSAGLTAIKYQL